MRRAGARCRPHPKHREASRRVDNRPVADPRVGPRWAPPARPPSLALPAAEVHGTEKGAPAQSVGQAVLHQVRGLSPVLDQELSLRKKKRYSFGRKSSGSWKRGCGGTSRSPALALTCRRGPSPSSALGQAPKTEGRGTGVCGPESMEAPSSASVSPVGPQAQHRVERSAPILGRSRPQACLREQTWDRRHYGGIKSTSLSAEGKALARLVTCKHRPVFPRGLEKLSSRSHPGTA